MKTLTLFFLIVFTTVLTVNAQITKGNWMVGGSGNFSIDKSESTSNGLTSSNKSSSFRITPNIGYFIADKFVVGLSPLMGFTNFEGSNNNVTSYGTSVFVRYYFLKPDNRINIFAQTSYGLSATRRNSEKVGNSNYFNFKTGPVLYFNSSVGIELTLAYNHDNLKSGAVNESTFQRISLNIGFQIHLEK